MDYRIPSYGKVLVIGHRAIADLFKGPVVIQEKIDGSQFSFGKVDGELFCRSRGQQLVPDAPEKLFATAVASVKERAHLLRDGWIYRAEYLKKPKHNTLAYDRVPQGHLVLFDAHPDPHGRGVTRPQALAEEAERLGLEAVPVLYTGNVASVDQLMALLDTNSVLGGCTVEGVVCKNYNTFNAMTGGFCCGKHVSEAFKERHQREWKKTNPSDKDVVGALIGTIRTEARWAKAVQHLRESGDLTETPSDIGSLIKEVQSDLLEEETQHIMDVLFRHFWPTIRRGCVAGLPEWYKEQVLTHAFNETN